MAKNINVNYLASKKSIKFAGNYYTESQNHRIITMTPVQSSLFT